MRTLKFTPVINAAIYAAGDVVGTKMDLGQIDGELRSISLADNAAQNYLGTVLLFDGDPGAVPANNAAFTFPAGSLAKLIGHVALPAVAVVGAKNVVTAPNVGLIVKSSQLYAVLVTGGTPTPVSASDLTIKFGIKAAGE